EYEGQQGKIAIRHYNIYDMFRLNVDDIQIGTPSDTEEAEWIYVYDLTSTDYLIEGLDPETTYEVQVQAYNDFNESPWSESVIFTTTQKTSIQEISAEVKGDNRYYNMMGQEVDGNNLPAGIYIHNGKKILVK
ncbi:MAG: fibronectin type III domain-containing protein, partial [Muribaculaceae bacterium]|nr:fibronectin type III domain-containing protein [Muribaculaceae bacterium]